MCFFSKSYPTHMVIWEGVLHLKSIEIFQRLFVAVHYVTPIVVVSLESLHTYIPVEITNKPNQITTALDNCIAFFDRNVMVEECCICVMMWNAKKRADCCLAFVRFPVYAFCSMFGSVVFARRQMCVCVFERVYVDLPTCFFWQASHSWMEVATRKWSDNDVWAPE